MSATAFVTAIGPEMPKSLMSLALNDYKSNLPVIRVFANGFGPKSI